MPPGRHSKNDIESKQKATRIIYLRLKEDAEEGQDAKFASYKAVTTSNYLYGNDTI